MLKLLTAAAVAALLAGSVGLTGLMPALAQDATTAAAPATPAPDAAADQSAAPGAGTHGWRGRQGMPMGHPGGMPAFGGMQQRFGAMRADLFAIACGDRGSEAIEIGFVHAKYALKLTSTQQPLFDALQTAALNDQKSFADTCRAAVGADGAGAKPSVLDRLQTQLALETAKVAALNDVLPKFKALYDTLTDQQKQALEQSGRQDMRFGMMQQGRPGWQPGWRQHMNHGQKPWMNGTDGAGQATPTDMSVDPADDGSDDATAPGSQS